MGYGHFRSFVVRTRHFPLLFLHQKFDVILPATFIISQIVSLAGIPTFAFSSIG
jgi:hypothetical protein